MQRALRRAFQRGEIAVVLKHEISAQILCAVIDLRTHARVCLLHAHSAPHANAFRPFRFIAHDDDHLVEPIFVPALEEQGHLEKGDAFPPLLPRTSLS